MKLLKGFALFLSIMLLSSIVSAAEVLLAWDPNIDEVTGYRVFATRVGEDYDYTNPLYDGTATSCTIVIDNAAEYKFVARAYLTVESGETYESINSNEIRHAIVIWTNPNLRVQ